VACWFLDEDRQWGRVQTSGELIGRRVCDPLLLVGALVHLRACLVRGRVLAPED
jgi:hypothetical protein